MSKLNVGSRLVTAPLRTEVKPSGKTREGAPGFAHDARSELFMRATTIFTGEGAFYEQGEDADERAAELVRQLAVTDWKWLSGFLPWLRADGTIRTSAIKLAADAAGARSAAGIHTRQTRHPVALTMLRGEEPGEMLQYALRTFGKLPVQLREAVAFAATSLYTERAVIRWDKPERPVRFADVIELTHPKPKDAHQKLLFRYLLDARHHGNFPDDEGYGAEPPRQLGMIHSRWKLSRLLPAERHALAAKALQDPDGPESRAVFLAAAGQWEWVTSWLGEGVKGLGTALSGRERWELVIPWMGYEALLKNLRNFDHAGIRGTAVDAVSARLADPAEVANSRQLPLRFLSAYLNAPSLSWGRALERALDAAIANVPVLGGHTLIMIDMSGSMQHPLSVRPPRHLKPGEPAPAIPDRITAASLFALALAHRNPGKAEVFGFADLPRNGKNPGNAQFRLPEGMSVLKQAEHIRKSVGLVGHATYIEQNAADIFRRGHYTRVVLFSDLEAYPYARGYGGNFGEGDIARAIPDHVPVYAWNLAGTAFGAMAAKPNRVALAGLSDASFGMMGRYEAHQSGLYPWEYETPQRFDDEDGDQ